MELSWFLVRKPLYNLYWGTRRIANRRWLGIFKRSKNGPPKGTKPRTSVERRAEPLASLKVIILQKHIIKYGSLLLNFCPCCEDVSSLYFDISVLSFKHRVVSRAAEGRIWTFKSSQDILFEKWEIFEGESSWLIY